MLSKLGLGFRADAQIRMAQPRAEAQDGKGIPKPEALQALGKKVLLGASCETQQNQTTKERFLKTLSTFGNV